MESLASPPGSRGRQLDAEELAALEAEQGARVRPRKKIWVLRDDVAEALEQGRYDGPGSFFSQRGNKVQ
ncbi:hypothetical protein AB0N81_38610 [Streptomyces sp. NPDC093510]|uniref:hypothetical protein n=1 Tax=Streptomyces sp. NPDC093510 TaxID=3155199 RepID=UPI0034330827